SNPYKWAINGAIMDVAEIYLDGDYVDTVSVSAFEDTASKDRSKEVDLTFFNLTPGVHVITVSGYYTYANAPVSCNPIVDECTFTVKEPPTPEPEPTPVPPDPTLIDG
ncbi:MAG: hypothetical protein II510_04230, partial [Erysipelotrichales bacterium]|nr:hypothetical protein [Erysipelotrichales bacterium]